MEGDIEVAALLPIQGAAINDHLFQSGEIVEFDKDAGRIEIENPSTEAIDVLLFGREEYGEPIVAEGPFVMNTSAEVIGAYRDFHAGKYGEIVQRNFGR